MHKILLILLRRYKERDPGSDVLITCKSLTLRMLTVYREPLTEETRKTSVLPIFLTLDYISSLLPVFLSTVNGERSTFSVCFILPDQIMKVSWYNLIIGHLQSLKKQIVTDSIYPGADPDQLLGKPSGSYCQGLTGEFSL